MLQFFVDLERGGRGGGGGGGSVFFPREKKIEPVKKSRKCAREKKVPVKISEKPSKNAREKNILPVKFFMKFHP